MVMLSQPPSSMHLAVCLGTQPPCYEEAQVTWRERPSDISEEAFEMTPAQPLSD